VVTPVGSTIVSGFFTADGVETRDMAGGAVDAVVLVSSPCGLLAGVGRGVRADVGFDAGVSAVNVGEGESALATLEVATGGRVLVVGAVEGITVGRTATWLEAGARLVTGTMTAVGGAAVETLGAG
jgi:hypothetical protein